MKISDTQQRQSAQRAVERFPAGASLERRREAAITEGTFFLYFAEENGVTMLIATLN